MDLHDLTRALLEYDTLAARQWVADAIREQITWTRLPQPQLDTVGMAVAAGVIEMLAERYGQAPPPWTAGVKAAPKPIFLSREALRLPRLRRLCEQEGPESLRRRAVYAPPEFLTFA